MAGEALSGAEYPSVLSVHLSVRLFVLIARGCVVGIISVCFSLSFHVFDQGEYRRGLSLSLTEVG